MGRKKKKMELISNERARKAIFKKRKESLVRNTQELCKLCDVKACIIIYDCDTRVPEIWPQNVDDMMDLAIKSAEGHNVKFELMDYFNLRKMEVEKELSKLREKNMEAKYSTPVDMLDSMSESELRDFAVKLKNRAEYVRSTLIQTRSSENKLVLQQGISGLIWGGSNSMDFGNELMPMRMNEVDAVQQLGFGGTDSSSMPQQLHMSTGWENNDDGGLEDLLNFCMSSSPLQDSI